MSQSLAMTFWDHVNELRKRILRSLLLITLGAIGGYIYSDKALDFLIQPFREKVEGTLALLAPGDGFVIQLKLALMLGLIVSSPFVAYQLYGFVSPALKKKEKLWIIPVALISTVLFWGGVWFAWILLPPALEFFGSYTMSGIQNMWSLSNYISLVIFLLLAFGIIFQLPLIIGVLIASGLVPSSFFRRNRRFAIVAIFIISAFATPTTDMLTMLMMALPLMVLYELSIWAGVYIERRRKSRKQTSA